MNGKPLGDGRPITHSVRNNLEDYILDDYNSLSVSNLGPFLKRVISYLFIC